MNKYKIFFLFLFSLHLSLSAQQGAVSIIKGTVVDRETGEPLAGASIYFAETTTGTTAQKKGDYLIEVKKPGNYVLVVSMVGYGVQQKNMQLEKGQEYTVDFKMIQKPLDVKTIEVIGEDQSEWQKNLKTFTRKFIGVLEPSGYCLIENKELINFRWNKDTLIAYSDKPIIVINKYLGYRVICEIVEYKYEPVSTYQEYSIFSRFEELLPEDSSQKEKWESNRVDVFYGSPIHFLWSLRNNNLLSQKFSVHFISAPFAGNASRSKEVKDLEDIKYQEQFSYEPIISFAGYLEVKYNDYQVSYIKSRFPLFTIDSYGIADNHLPFLCYGYWSNLGLSTMLPRGYLPAQLKK